MRLPFHCCGRFRPWVNTGATLVLVLAGCSHYDGRSDPLGPAAVAAALQPPTLDRLRIAATKLDHPLLAPLVIDGRNGFTPDEVALLAVLSSPQLRALRDQRGVARAQVLQAGLLPNPQLGYALDQPHGNADPSLIPGRNLGLSWDLTSLIGRQDRIDSAHAAAAAVSLDIAWQEWQVAQGARLSAYRLLGLRQRLPLLRQIEGDAGDTLAAVRRAEALGHLTVIELTTATDQWMAAKNNLFAAEQEERAESSALDLVLGLPPGTKVGLQSPASAAAGPASLTPAELLVGLEKRRLDLVALTLGYESNEADLRAQVKTQFPKIGLNLNKANDTSDVKTRGFGLTVDLPLFDRNQGAIAAARATRQQLFDEYVMRVAEARAEVVQLWDNLGATRRQLAAATAALPEWEHLLAAYDRAVATRDVDASAWRDARIALATHRLDVADLQQQVRELEVGLEIATGRSSLNGPPAP